MKDLVSKWTHLVSLAASMSVVWAVFSPYGFPWMGLVWASLALSVALWLRMRSTRSIAHVLADVEAEPVRAVAAPRPVGVMAPKAVL